MKKREITDRDTSRSILESTSVRLAFTEVSNYREPMFREGRMPHQKRQDLSLPE